jgi:hypothetical protein
MSPLLSTFANGSARGYGAYLASGAALAFESIATATGNGSSATITFSSIPSTYKHLHLRMSILTSANSSGVQVRVNGVSSSIYTTHYFAGDGTTVSAGNSVSTSRFALTNYGSQTDTSFPTVGILDIIDYAVTSKYKTGRMISGVDKNGSGEIVLSSGLYPSTTAVSSIEFSVLGGPNFATGTTISLYGIKG